MSIAEKIKTFNSILEDLLKQLSPRIGSSYHFYFNKLIKINSVLPIQHFLFYALPMKDKLLNRDDDYFSNPVNYAKHFEGDNDRLNEFIKLRKFWDELSEKDKDGLWDITQALLITGIEYIELKGK